MRDAKVSADLGHLFILRAVSCRGFPALDRVHELLDLTQHGLLIAGEGEMIDARQLDELRVCRRG